MSLKNCVKITSPVKLKTYTIKIGENLYQRVDKLMHLLKYTDSACNTRQKWIIDAFINKLDTEDLLGSEGIPKEKYLHFQLDEELKNKIDRRVELLAKFRTSFSKKQWFLEAIYEKLDSDERKMQQRLKEKNRLIDKER